MKINSLLNKFFSKGFTLIELIVVIAIIGILVAGILVAIDPIDKVNQANDAKVQNDISSAGKASERYATTHDGFYPANYSDLVDSGELKIALVQPKGYNAYTKVNTPVGCIAGTTCTGILLSGQLRSKGYVNAVPPTPFWNYDSVSVKNCAAATAETTCP